MLTCERHKNVELADTSFRIKTYLEIHERMSRPRRGVLNFIDAFMIFFGSLVIFLNADFIRGNCIVEAIFRGCVPTNRTIKIDFLSKINTEMRLYLLPKRMQKYIACASGSVLSPSCRPHTNRRYTIESSNYSRE